MDADSSRDRLISAAAVVLWDKGYSAASPRSIQAAAGVGQGSMYHHFEGKADLARAAIESVAADLMAEAETILAGPGSALERIETYLLKKRSALRGCRLGRLVADAELVDDPRLQGPISEFFLRLQADLAAVVGELDLPPEVDPGGLAAMIVSVIQGGYVLSRARRDVRCLDQAVETAVHLVRCAAGNRA